MGFYIFMVRKMRINCEDVVKKITLNFFKLRVIISKDSHFGVFQNKLAKKYCHFFLY